MSGRLKGLGRSFTVLTRTAILWVTGAGFPSVPNASGQSVLQSYSDEIVSGFK